MTPKDFGATVLTFAAKMMTPVTREAQTEAAAFLDIAEALAQGRLTLTPTEQPKGE